MRLLALCVLVFGLFSCNDLDGTFKVLSDFMLTDEDGRVVHLRSGSYVAELSYDTRKGEVELEVKGVDGDDERDFEFKLPSHMNESEFYQKRLEVHLPIAHGDDDLHIEMLVHNEYLKQQGPLGAMIRCNNVARRSMAWRMPVVYHYVERNMQVTASINRGEEQLAMIDASGLVKSQYHVWHGNCGDDWWDMPAWAEQEIDFNSDKPLPPIPSSRP